MIEDKIWSDNPEKFIIGSDEVGRGSFAGPICASAVRVNYHQMQSFRIFAWFFSNNFEQFENDSFECSQFFVLLRARR